ncbi:MAG: RagB/SusD family nutrient uptake outer membrane protein [Lentimicrobiaceae bacterium]|jgi:hypothetical protein
MKKTYIISLTALLLLVAAGCKKDFLEVRPTEFLTEDQVAKAAEHNPAVVAGSIAGIYTLMFQTFTGGTTGHDDFGQKGYDIKSDMLSGDMALTANVYNWYGALTRLTSTIDYTNNNNYIPWRYYYRIIRSANSVIAQLGGNDAIPVLDANKYMMGQAKALRAYGYFYLAQFYATSYDPTAKILPVYTDPLQQNQPKSTTDTVYALIVKDLTESVSLLETFNRTDKHEINKYVAEGLLAYTYGAMGNYAEAKTLTADIIANGGFSLTTATEAVYAGDKTLGGFNKLTSPAWMWGVKITSDLGLDLVSWFGQMDRYTYSYQWAGDRKGIDKGLFDMIPADDIRKGQFDSDPASTYLLCPTGKFYDAGRKTGGARTPLDDYLYMRVDEMYLLNAEASAKSGDDAGARTSLKALLSLRVPSTDYVDALSGQALQDEIYLQTRIELWGEGKSYLAMKRNKATIVRGSNHLSFVGVPIPYNDPRLTYSIPQSEVQNNPFINN